VARARWRQAWDFQVSGWLRLVIGRRPVLTLARVVLLVVLYFGVVREVFIPIRVSGPSMEPTLMDGRIKLLYRRAYHSRDPQRGDVVGIRMEGTRRLVLKRILGLPGEQVAVLRGRVYINHQLLDPYGKGRGIPATRGEILLGPHDYFAIGDNRNLTAYDVVHRWEIVGKAL